MAPVVTVSSRLIGFAACLAVAGCATSNPEGPHYSWPADERPLAPIVIRTASIDSVAPDPAGASAKAMGTTAHELLLTGLLFFWFPIGPAFALIGIPASIVDGQKVYLNETRCHPRLRDAIGDVPGWVRSTFGATPVARLVADGARSQLRAGGPAVMVIDTAGSAAERQTQTEKLAKDTGARTLVLADISVLFGETHGEACDVKLLARAAIRVQPVGVPESREPRYSVWVEQPQVPLAQWASEPERARRQLGDLLTDLGRRLAASYAERMRCGEEPCEWDATGQVTGLTETPASGAPRWCLVSPSATAVTCGLATYEQCAASKPDDAYRCVPGD